MSAMGRMRLVRLGWKADAWNGRPAWMEQPDFQLGGTSHGLFLWVERPAVPDSADYWDANWLNVRAQMKAPGAVVTCETMFMTTDFERFLSELQSLNTKLTGVATLCGLEPELKLVLNMLTLGHVACEIEITPDQLEQFHRFNGLGFDQTYLPAIIASCEAIVENHPTIGAP